MTATTIFLSPLLRAEALLSQRFRAMPPFLRAAISLRFFALLFFCFVFCRFLQPYFLLFIFAFMRHCIEVSTDSRLSFRFSRLLSPRRLQPQATITPRRLSSLLPSTPMLFLADIFTSLRSATPSLFLHLLPMPPLPPPCFAAAMIFRAFIFFRFSLQSLQEELFLRQSFSISSHFSRSLFSSAFAASAIYSHIRHCHCISRMNI